MDFSRPLKNPVQPFDFEHVDELELFREVWCEALMVLQDERQLLFEAARLDGNRDTRAVMRLIKIEYEMAMYELCIDRADEAEERRELLNFPDRRKKRSHFFHLMAILAKAEVRRNGGAADVHFVSEAKDDPGWDDSRWIRELESAAMKACAALIWDREVPSRPD